MGETVLLGEMREREHELEGNAVVPVAFDFHTRRWSQALGS